MKAMECEFNPSGTILKYCLNKEIQSIVIPETVKMIERRALAMTGSFSLAPGNQRFACDEAGALFRVIPGRPHQTYSLVAFPCSFRGEYRLPRDVEEIQDMAFFGCSGLCGTLELGGALAAEFDLQAAKKR